MHIQSFTSTKSPFLSPFEIAPQHQVHPRGHITVMIGENGVRKSLALRLLMDAALGQPVHKGYGHPPIDIGIVCRAGMPAKVIAVSVTPWDRFPRSWALSELALSIPWFNHRFSYIGPRSREGLISVRYNEAVFGRALLENQHTFQSRIEALTPIFAKAGLSPNVGIRFAPKWRALRGPMGVIVEKSLTVLREKLRKRLAKIMQSPYFSDHWKHTIREFVHKFAGSEVETLWKALEACVSPKISCWIDANGTRYMLGFQSISDWRCALYLELFEVGAVFFVPKDAGIPTNQKHTLRESDLSSGQWNWLYSLVSLCIELDDNALVLIDEPENSLHPSWQRDFVPTLTKILSCCSGCHAVVATHSGFIASGVSEENGNVRRLALHEPHPGTPRQRALTASTPPSADTYGAQVDDVYRDLFGLESTRTPEFVARVDKLLALISEADGKRPIVASEDRDYILLTRAHLPPHDPMRSILLAIEKSIDVVGS
jgi:hypothetical protein